MYPVVNERGNEVDIVSDTEDEDIAQCDNCKRLHILSTIQRISKD